MHVTHVELIAHLDCRLFASSFVDCLLILFGIFSQIRRGCAGVSDLGEFRTRVDDLISKVELWHGLLGDVSGYTAEGEIRNHNILVPFKVCHEIRLNVP